MWQEFLKHPAVYCRPFVDFEANTIVAEEIRMYSDATANPKLGMGAICQSSWMYQQWDEEFILKNKPSIAFLELYALLAGVVTWINRFQNRRIVLWCDNISVVHMINQSSSGCKQCMVLIRILVLFQMIYNVRINAKHVAGVHNIWAGLLSRLQIDKFKSIAGRDFETHSTRVPDLLWPMSNIWMDN